MRYYVYILLDDRFSGNYDNHYCKVDFKPFYVGKGDSMSKNKNERHLIHYKETKQTLNKISNPQKYNTIKILQNKGYEPNFLIVCRDDDEKIILEIEKRNFMVNLKMVVF